MVLAKYLGYHYNVQIINITNKRLTNDIVSGLYKLTFLFIKNKIIKLTLVFLY